MMFKNLFPLVLGTLTLFTSKAEGISAGVIFRLQDDSSGCTDAEQATLIDISVDALAAAGLSLDGDWSMHRGGTDRALMEEEDGEEEEADADAEFQELMMGASPHHRRLCDYECWLMCTTTQQWNSEHCACCTCCSGRRRGRNLSLRGLQKTTDATIHEIARKAESEATNFLKELPTAPACLNPAFEVVVNLREDSPDRTEGPFE